MSLFQIRTSSALPNSIGYCITDPRIKSATNEATERLHKAGGETGFWGGWSRIAFEIARTNPYLTLGREFARAVGFDVCQQPVQIKNEFYEFLEDGIGLRNEDSTCACKGRCATLRAYERGTFPTMVDLTATNQYLRVYPTETSDVGKKLFFIGAKDVNGNPIYEWNGTQRVNGAFLTLAAPFTTSAMIITSFSRVLKDLTDGDVELKQADATTAAEVLLSRYAADETSPDYRRYYFANLPTETCCPTDTTDTLTLTALCKREFIPLRRDTDFNLIGNIPALIQECQAIRYERMDTAEAKQLAEYHHKKAVKLLNDELRHYAGEQNASVAVSVRPFGSARLEQHHIGMR